MSSDKSTLIAELQQEIVDVRKELAKEKPELMQRLAEAEAMLSRHKLGIDLADLSWVDDCGLALDLAFMLDPTPRAKSVVIEQLRTARFITAETATRADTVNDIINYRLKKKQMVRHGRDLKKETVVSMATKRLR